jgi:FlaA1/EpsC-like NDP-sugar epimerase
MELSLVARRLVERISKTQLVLIFTDIVVTNWVLWVSYWLRFDGAIPTKYVGSWEVLCLSYTIVRLAVFYYFKLYKSLWSYASISEVITIMLAVTISSFVGWGIIEFSPVLSMPKSVAILAWLLSLFFVGGIRFNFRILRERQLKSININAKKILIIGAGDAGTLVVRELKKEAAGYPVAFIDDDEKKQRLLINGIPVLGTRFDIPKIVSEKHIDEIVVALPSAPRTELKAILSICRKTSVPVKILPGVYEILNGVVSVSQIREVSIEDLLGRDPVRIDLKEIAGYLKGERVLVTGAGGSIGSELCRQISRFHPECIILLGRGENSIYEIDQELSVFYPQIKRYAVIADVRDRDRMSEVFAQFKPSVVFHAAAHKHVPLMEEAPVEAVKNNVLGTKNVVHLADEHGVKRFVLVSTDKAVNPTSVMGATKRFAELIIQSYARNSATKYCAVRFGNVLGSRGSVIPLLKKQIARGGPVTVTDAEMKRYFMTIPEAVSLVIQAGSMGDNGEIFVLDMGQPVKIVDLARDLIQLSGYEPNVDIKIEITGMRPGEKLFEELLTAEEGTQATKHERIYVAKPVDGLWEHLKQKVAQYMEQKVSEVEMDPLTRIYYILSQHGWNHNLLKETPTSILENKQSII